MNEPLTLIDKLWSAHEIARREDGATLLWVDRHYVHEGSFLAFSQLQDRGRAVAEPGLTFGIADHYVPTRGRKGAIADPSIAAMVTTLEANTAASGISLFGLGDPRQGIVHVVGPEQGLTLPGLLIVCGDSHTSTHGAFGAYAFGIGASEVAHVLMTQTLWQKKPRRMRVVVSGMTTTGIGAKDIALTVIARIGADGARGHAVEFAGSAIAALSMEGRMTLCNMSIEAGGRCGMVAPDATTFSYLKGRSYAPRDAAFDRAVEAWSKLATDSGAVFDREVALDAHAIAPIVTWGTTPDDALPIDGNVPDPARRRRSGARQISARRPRLYGDRAGQEADRHRHRSHFHRLVHQCADRRFARRCGSAGRPRQQGAGAGVAGLLDSEAAGRSGRPRPHLSRRRTRMGRLRLFDVCRHQRRHRTARRALCVDHQPQFPRPPGTRRAHASDVAGDGGRGGGDRAPCRCAAAARRPEGVRSKPMEKFVRLTAKACPLLLANVDTDQILPARFLKLPRSAELGRVLLNDLRRDAGGKENPDFPLNRPASRDAKILVAGRNFGGGSSREAAVYALYEAGFRCVIAPSFGDIFAQNSVKNGLLTAVLSEADATELGAAIAADPDMPVTVDLEQQTISRGNRSFAFTIDPVSRNQLLNGWDDVDLTDSFGERIAAFKAADRRPPSLGAAA